MLMLCWLSVSLPFVYAAQQAVESRSTAPASNTENNDVPYTEKPEEKSKCSNSTVEEYLHDLLHADLLSESAITFHKRYPSDLYLAYHPELVIPPPEA